MTRYVLQRRELATGRVDSTLSTNDRRDALNTLDAFVRTGDLRFHWFAGTHRLVIPSPDGARLPITPDDPLYRDLMRGGA